jgi:energy-converting hydrogenase Eha subunit A
MSFWEWFTLIVGIIGILGFLMAIAPFIQMIYGKPKIEFDFSEKHSDDGTTIFECAIINPPIDNAILQTIGVTRNIALGTMAIVKIKEKRTGNKLYSDWVKLISGFGVATQRADLPSGYIPARFMVITVYEKTSEVYAGNKLTGEEALLPIGLYEVSIEVTVSGKVIRTLNRELMVQATQPFAYWVK